MTNCKICGEENCMAFAAKLVNREATLDQCPPIMQENYKSPSRASGTRRT
ncbi:MAG: (Fe-S)-binding protein [Candidatus Bathyarchaeia archaeon]